MRHVLVAEEVYKRFCWENLREDLGVDGGDNIKMNLQEIG